MSILNKKNVSPQRIMVTKPLNKDFIKFLNFVFKDVEIILFKIETACKEEPTLLLLTGGPDVSPTYYASNKSKFTIVDKERDILDKKMVSRYSYLPKLGICRGAQFLCAIAGGKLIQHVEGHKEEHLIQTKEFMPVGHFKTYKMSSTHHQMMFPFRLPSKKFNLISWSYKFRGNIYINGSNNQLKLPDNFLEPEIIYFNNTNALAIQGHPEFKDTNKETLSFVKSVILKYLY